MCNNNSGKQQRYSQCSWILCPVSLWANYLLMFASLIFILGLKKRQLFVVSDLGKIHLMQKIWENGKVKKEKVAITCNTSIQRQINQFDFNNFCLYGI